MRSSNWRLTPDEDEGVAHIYGGAKGEVIAAGENGSVYYGAIADALRGDFRAMTLLLQ